MKKNRPLRYLITAGPTREFLDPIRFISNRSSGKMGYAIAAAARKISPDVVLVSGPTALKVPRGVKTVLVTTAEEMAHAVFQGFAKADVVIMAAAVCDFRPLRVAYQKIKKTTLDVELTLQLEPTTDILKELGRRKRHHILVGFAAETNAIEQFAQEKLFRKNLDLIVANDTSGFDGDTNTVTLIHRTGQVERLPEMTKRRLAGELIKRARAIACQKLTGP